MNYETLALVANGLLIGFLGAQTSLSFPVRCCYYLANALTVSAFGYCKLKGI